MTATLRKRANLSVLATAGSSDLPRKLEFTRLRNVAVKVSALPCYVDEPYPFPTLHPIVRRVVDAFGPQRCFWGTDLSHLPCPYKQVVTLFTEEIKSLSAFELEWVMGRGIAEWLGWPLSE